MTDTQEIPQTVNEVEAEDNNTETNVNVIEAENPAPEEMKVLVGQIKANYDFDVNVRPTLFRFKKSTDKETGIITERQPVELAIPYPTVQGIINILEKGGKGLELLQEAMESVVNAQARELLYEDIKLNAANFPVEKLAWEFIANIPKAQRRGGGIPKETWEAFVNDYIEVMPAATGKNVTQVTNAAKLLANKLNSVKTNEHVLNLLVEQLAIYNDASPNKDDYSECIEFLLDKADTYLNMSPEDLTANL